MLRHPTVGCYTYITRPSLLFGPKRCPGGPSRELYWLEDFKCTYNCVAEASACRGLPRSAVPLLQCTRSAPPQAPINADAAGAGSLRPCSSHRASVFTLSPRALVRAGAAGACSVRGGRAQRTVAQAKLWTWAARMGVGHECMRTGGGAGWRSWNGEAMATQRGNTLCAACSARRGGRAGGGAQAGLTGGVRGVS